MNADVVLCAAPVLSVVRPSIALGLLQAATRARGISVESLYLNLMFAERIGVDLNEDLANETPSALLASDWLFSGEIGAAPAAAAVAEHRAALARHFKADGVQKLQNLKDRRIAPFVDEAAARILARRPRIVGFTTTFEQTVASLAIARRLKAQDPSIVTCFGGANCHGPMGRTLLKHYDQIDYVFTGEADFAFADFAEALLTTGSPGEAEGWVSRSGQGRDAGMFMALDALPVPDYADYHRQLAQLSERGRIRPSTPFESSRGCWWGQKRHCTFCGLNADGMTFRAKSADRVIRELTELEQTYGVRNFGATDNIISLKHVEGVLGKLADTEPRSAPRRLFYEIKSNMNERDLTIMARAGVVWVQPGIESLSDEVLGIMRKGVTALLNIRMLRNCGELGMGVVWSILYGFPGEPADDYDRIADFLPLLSHLAPPVSCVRIRLDRFSPNYERAAEMGFSDLAPAPAYGAVHGLPADSLADLAYFFEGRAHSAASEADLVRLRAAVADWRAGWYAQETIPQLSAMEVQGGVLIKDTRVGAIEPLCYLTGAAAALLALARSPRALGQLAADLGATYAPDAVEDALIALHARGFILQIDDCILALPTDAAAALFDADDRSDHPTGFVLPPGSAGVAGAAGLVLEGATR